MLDFLNKSEIAVSGVLKQYWQWVSESETESKPKKIWRNLRRPGFIAYLLSDGYPIQKLEIPNLKFETPN